MILFVGLTVLVLLLACFCNTRESVQLHMDSRLVGRETADTGWTAIGNGAGLNSGPMTRQQALNLWCCCLLYLPAVSPAAMITGSIPVCSA